MKWLGKNKQKRTDNTRIRNTEPRQKVISYYTASRRQLDNFERQSQFGNEPILLRHAKGLKSKWFHFVVIVVLVACVVYLGSLGTQPRVVIEGPQYRSAKEYQAVIMAVYGNALRNRIKPLLMTKQIEESVAKAVPEASTVVVSSSFLGHQPDLKITTDEPMMTFTQPNAPDLLMSKRGRLLLSTSLNTKLQTTSLPVLQNQTGVVAKAGEQFMRPDETVALQRLIGQYAVENSKPIFSLTTTPHEIIAKESGRGTYYARFLLDDSIVGQFGALRATEKKIAEMSQQANEYIDVRLGDKAYYK